MASIAVLTEFTKAIDPAVNIVFNGAYKQAGETHKDICNVMSTELYQEELSSNVGLSMASLVTEQAHTSYEALLQGNSKTLTQYEYRIGTQISKHLASFNRLNQIKSLISTSGLAVGRRKQFDITKLIDRFDSTSYTHTQDGSTVINLTGGDSAALQSSTHSTVRTSTSISNVISDGKRMLCRHLEIFLRIMKPINITL